MGDFSTVIRRDWIGTQHRTNRYVYDCAGRVVSVGWNLNSSTRYYAYDDYNRLAGHITRLGSTTLLTTGITYCAPSSSTTSERIESLSLDGIADPISFEYTYDGNGNIIEITISRNQISWTISYAYDAANQLVRENNPITGYTWLWTYDDAGNITSWKQYAYNIGTLSTLLDSANYSYGDSSWGDLLTTYDGSRSFSYDTIGNLLSDGQWSYTWERGRRLKSMSNGTQTWTFTYSPDGMRSGRSNGSTTWEYIYDGGNLLAMLSSSTKMYFTYDSAGQPIEIEYNGVKYYYLLNAQGDVFGLIDSSGTQVVTYNYNAWGRLLSTTGSLASTLGIANPLRYRGYVYDTETGLYYLQSRYYNPEIGRFINADVYAATGQGLLGNNMFAYCLNNPVRYKDTQGHAAADCFDTDGEQLSNNELDGRDGGGGGFWDSFMRTMQSAADGLSMAMGNHTLPSSGLTPQPATQKNPLRNITYTDKVQAQMQKGDYHSFPSVVDNYGSFGTQTTFQGGDGNMYTKLAIPGSYHGEDGFFVYIWNSFGQCNHRLFEVSY